MRSIFSLFLIFIVIIAGCRTTETVSESEPDRPIFDIDEEIATEYLVGEMDEYDRFLFENRSFLTDQFASVEHDMPEIFLREVVTDDYDIDERVGFRVQILSTRNIAEADSVLDEFRAWANEQIEGYDAQAYILFRQPNYRVRTGDFQNRNQAIEFSRLVKTKFPDAWIVHDRIEPDQVPAENADIRIRDRSSSASADGTEN